MIDVKNGSVKLEDINFVLSPHLTLDEFKKSNLYNNQNFERLVDIERHTIFDKPFYIDICFDKAYLSVIILTIDDDKLKGWEDEKKRKIIHDLILKKYGIGTDQKFNWGGIKSLYDLRSGISNIIIYYD